MADRRVTRSMKRPSTPPQKRPAATDGTEDEVSVCPPAPQKPRPEATARGIIVSVFARRIECLNVLDRLHELPTRVIFCTPSGDILSAVSPLMGDDNPNSVGFVLPARIPYLPDRLEKALPWVHMQFDRAAVDRLAGTVTVRLCTTIKYADPYSDPNTHAHMDCDITLESGKPAVVRKLRDYN